MEHLRETNLMLSLASAHCTRAIPVLSRNRASYQHKSEIFLVPLTSAPVISGSNVVSRVVGLGLNNGRKRHRSSVL